MGRRQSDAYRRGRMQGPSNDSTSWLNSPRRTDAERREFTRGAADDLRAKAQQRQAGNGRPQGQNQRRTPANGKAKVRGHRRTVETNGLLWRRTRQVGVGSYKRKVNGGRSQPASGRGTSRPTRRQPAKKKNQQTPLIHPDRAKQYLTKALDLRTTNGRKATGCAAAGLSIGLAYFTGQLIFWVFAALAFIAVLAGALLDEVTKNR